MPETSSPMKDPLFAPGHLRDVSRRIWGIRAAHICINCTPPKTRRSLPPKSKKYGKRSRNSMLTRLDGLEETFGCFRIKSGSQHDGLALHLLR